MRPSGALDLRMKFLCSLLVKSLAILLLTSSVETAHGAAGPPKRWTKGYNEQLVVKSGTTLRLTCPVEPDPTLLVEWMKDSHVVRPGWDDRYRLVSSSSSPVVDDGVDPDQVTSHVAVAALRIRDVTPADTGTFVCLATNGFGTVEVSFDVSVISSDSNDSEILQSNNVIAESTESFDYPPKFKALDKMTPHLTLPVGRTEKLTCSSSGQPTPRVTWYKDGVQLRVLNDYGGVEDQLQQLVLSNVQKSDGGTYQCQSANALGNISFTYQVYIIDGINLRPEFALTHPHNVTVSRGHSASFMCYVRSPSSEPHIQWLKRIDSILSTTEVGSEQDGGSNDVTIIKYDGHLYAVVGGSSLVGQYDIGTVQRRDGTYLSKLKIKRVTEHDVGMYVCSTTNHAGYNYRLAYLTLLPPTGHSLKDLSQLGDMSTTTMTSSSSSSQSIIVESFFPLAIVTAALTTFAVTIIIVTVAFRRRHHSCRSVDSALQSSASATSTSGHVLRRSMTLVVSAQSSSSASLPLQSDAFATTDVGMKFLDGLHRGGRRTLTLDDRNPYQQQQQHQQRQLSNSGDHVQL